MKVAIAPALQADILADALPYLQALYGKTVVVNLSASLIREPSHHAGIARDLALLKLVGVNLVVVHDDAQVADYPLASVNQSLVGLINCSGGNAVGLSGQDGQMMSVSIIDGNAGIAHLSPTLPALLQAHDYIPVLMPLSTAEDGEVHTVSGSILAGQLAQSLKAEKLIMLGEHAAVDEVYGLHVNGIISAAEMEKEMASHRPPAELELRASLAAAIDAVRHGVATTHLLDGRIANALLLELLTSEGIGTLICSDQSPHFLADSSRYFTGGTASLGGDMKLRKNLVVRF